MRSRRPGVNHITPKPETNRSIGAVKSKGGFSSESLKGSFGFSPALHTESPPASTLDFEPSLALPRTLSVRRTHFTARA